MPSEEDEVTLMDFLRTSNQDAPPVSNIQRKSWGSLGNEYYFTKFKKINNIIKSPCINNYLLK